MFSKLLSSAAVLSVASASMTTQMSMCDGEGTMPLANSETNVRYVAAWYGSSDPFTPPQGLAFMMQYATGVCTATTPYPGTNSAKFVCDADGMGFTYETYTSAQTGCSGMPVHSEWYTMANFTMGSGFSFNCATDGTDAYTSLILAAGDSSCTSIQQTTNLALNVCVVGALPSAPTDYLFNKINCDATETHINFFDFVPQNMCGDDVFCTALTATTSCGALFQLPAGVLYAEQKECTPYSSTDAPSSPASRALSTLVVLVSALVAAIVA